MTAPRSLFSRLADLLDVDTSGLTATGDGLAWDAVASKVVSLPGTLTNVRHPRYGAKGDGVTDDRVAINAATQAADGGLTVVLGTGVFPIGNVLDGTRSNVVINGAGGTLKRLASSNNPLLFGSAYSGYEFRNIIFDGNKRGGGGNTTFNVGGGRRIKFYRCTFRDPINGYFFSSCRNIVFEECEFYGTVTGTMASGTLDPVENNAAVLSAGLMLSQGNRDITVSRCLFHFCSNGIAVNTQVAQSPSRGLTIVDCRFRSDWWNGPYVTRRFQATLYNSSTKLLTANAGTAFNTYVNNNQVISFRRDMATGLTATLASNGTAVTLGSAVAGLAVGDSIETSTGLRAEITNVTSTTAVTVMMWESIDTYEAATAPASIASCRVSRYYAAHGFSPADATVSLYVDPVNPFTGERAVADAGLDLTTLPARILAKSTYGGIQVNANQEALLVTGNRCRGSWADQISVFDTTSPIVHNNHVEYCQDEGTTITRCPRAKVTCNTYHNTGTSGVFLGGPSNYSVVEGNTFHNWGIVNRTFRGGAIETAGLGLLIHGNETAVDAGMAGAYSNYLVALYGGDSTGSRIADNVDNGCKLGTISTDNVAAPTSGAITATNVSSARILGAGAANVAVGFGTPDKVSTDGHDLILTQQTTPASPADGEIFYGSQKILGGRFNGMDHRFVGCLFSLVTAGTVSNNAGELTLIDATGAVGTLTLPINFLLIGKTLRVRAAGVYSAIGASQGNLQLRLKFGSTTIGTGANQGLTASAANRGWTFDCIVTCRTTGSSGTVMVQGLETRSTTQNGIVAMDIENTAVTTVNTTTTQAVDLTAQFSVADPGNTITLHNLTIEVLN